MNTNTHAPHENIAAELVRRGLPVDYAQRAAAELTDHHGDLVAELCRTGMREAATSAEALRRLGDTRTLVKKTVREYQRRFWCGRWPLLTFIFGPLVLLLAAWIGTFLILAAIGYALEAAGIKPNRNCDDGIITSGEQIAMRCFIIWFMFVLPAGVLLFLSRRGARAGLGWQWVVLAAVMLAFNVGTMQCGFIDYLRDNTVIRAETGRQLPPDRFVISAPLWVCATSFSRIVTWFITRPQQIGQFLVPVIVAGVAIWRKRCLVQRWQRDLATMC